MNDSPSPSRAEIAEQLWNWLPAVYRARDEQQRDAAAAAAGRTPLPGEAGPLRSFVGLLADEFWRLRRLAEQQYDDHFIDSAQDWVIPYLADLVGSSVLFTGDAATLREVASRNREDVKNTMRRRRRKGTLPALEGAAADAGGFGVLALEMLARTAVTHHLLHSQAAAAGFTVDLRHREAVAALGTPFAPQPALADLRAADHRQGWHAVHKLIAFAWGIGISNAPPGPTTRPRPTRTGHLRQRDRGSGALSDRHATPPGAQLALICGLDLRVDPHSVTPRPLGAQRRPAALRRFSPRMWC